MKLRCQMVFVILALLMPQAGRELRVAGQETTQTKTPPTAANARLLRGKVVEVMGDALRVSVEGKERPKVGDPVKIVYAVPGSDILALVGTGKVSGVDGQIASVTVTEKSGEVRKGYLVDITSAASDMTKANYQKAIADGQLAMRRKQYADAADAFRNALKLRPNDPTAMKLLRQAVDEVVAQGRRLEQLWKDGQAAIAAKKYAAAAKLFSLALELMPGDKEAQLWHQFTSSMSIGQAAVAQKKYENAIKAYSEALRLIPTDQEARQELESATKSLAATRTKTPPVNPTDPPGTGTRLVRGKVVEVRGDTLRVSLDGMARPKVGDAVKIIYEVPGSDIIALVGKGKVSSVDDQMAAVAVSEKTGEIRKGYLVDISSVSPAPLLDLSGRWREEYPQQNRKSICTLKRRPDGQYDAHKNTADKGKDLHGIGVLTGNTLKIDWKLQKPPYEGWKARSVWKLDVGQARGTLTFAIPNGSPPETFQGSVERIDGR